MQSPEECNGKGTIGSKCKRFAAVLSAVIATATAVSACCDEKKPEESLVSSTKSTPSNTEAPQKDQLRFLAPELKDLTGLPSYDFSNTTKKTDRDFIPKLARGAEIPSNMSESEFSSIGAKFAQKAKSEIARPGKKNAREFVLNLLKTLQEIDPGAKRNLENFQKTWNGQLPYLIAKFNQYLIVGGVYLSYAVLGNDNDKFDILPIEAVRTIKIKDESLEVPVPLFELGKGLAPKGVSNISGDMMAESEPTYKYMVLYKQNGTAGLDTFYKRLSLFEKDVKRTPALDGQIFEDILRHESTHIFLSKKFPIAGNINEKDFSFNQKISISCGPKYELPFGGEMAPIYFHEMAAIGMQMAKTDVPYPYVLAAYTGPDSQITTADNTYGLTISMLPVISVMALSEGPEKDALVKAIEAESMQKAAVFQAISKEPDRVEYQRRVGKIFFSLGHGILGDLDKKLGQAK